MSIESCRGISATIADFTSDHAYYDPVPARDFSSQASVCCASLDTLVKLLVLTEESDVKRLQSICSMLWYPHSLNPDSTQVVD